VVRASGTEPLIRVMVEGEELWEIEEAAAAIVAAIEGCR
jgi:phosphoglucosamine mutase